MFRFASATVFRFFFATKRVPSDADWSAICLEKAQSGLQLAGKAEFIETMPRGPGALASMPDAVIL
jgi:hypothetical protein